MKKNSNYDLDEQLRNYLEQLVHPKSYVQVMAALDVRPMRHLTQALERLMHEDCAKQRPLISAMVTAKQQNIPAQGFFDLAHDLGFDVTNKSAFHQSQLKALEIIRI
ncbi:MAG: hypothetical protein QMC17_08125 [Paracoccaceae bacterium]|jgi:hypothetical protein